MSLRRDADEWWPDIGADLAAHVLGPENSYDGEWKVRIFDERGDNDWVEFTYDGPDPRKAAKWFTRAKAAVKAGRAFTDDLLPGEKGEKDG